MISQSYSQFFQDWYTACGGRFLGLLLQVALVTFMAMLQYGKRTQWEPPKTQDYYCETLNSEQITVLNANTTTKWQLEEN